ncbi:MAG: DUF2111 domain-containing protein [Methanomicrobiales archaeon]|nr:DUF2111 domain-containing protein [Methanomicrobiales archaeon]
MREYIIYDDATAEDQNPLTKIVHEMLSRLPVTSRSQKRRGVRIEDGRVVDTAYSGPVLEDVLAANRVVKKTPSSGAYRGVPVIVSPIRDDQGRAIAVIGVVDITGIFDLATLMEHQSAILRQICGKDPCPLPSEQIPSKR